ncbi:Methylase involved in ubiquinone/menaquinone biosynthesis [Dehalogenimonas alkenigignens]|uniref:Methylase involved in ubiquinone/menaquinone biosynthesis n=1 Tax=Dehalogenimonas alkenigignens TaxID=1217799 RepID=A0A0W0GL49_9CHLR|nr:class I SAM-dependent methyltransferase [Dehalogenimonas alkenigignens]KTB49289.1 Methylase involved in ubiquinone/menaquinone biosynthesis [Dehalogenimonas alkenigignens]
MDKTKRKTLLHQGAGEGDKYIPPLKFGWLTPAFDSLLRLTMRELVFKRQLIDQAHVEKGYRILDVGCGTGTLAIMIKSAHPDSKVTGLDADAKALEIAGLKIKNAGLEIYLIRGMSYNLPFPDGIFDRAFSSLMFHHLDRNNKQRTLQEVFRVLRPGGEFHLADFGRPRNPAMYLISQLLTLFERTQDNIRGLLPGMIIDAGFEMVEETANYLTMFGNLRLYRARKPR